MAALGNAAGLPVLEIHSRKSQVCVGGVEGAQAPRPAACACLSYHAAAAAALTECGIPPCPPFHPCDAHPTSSPSVPTLTISPCMLAGPRHACVQAQREKASAAFRSSSSAILFSSDVSARGVDYPDITLVLQVGVGGGC